MTTFGFVIPGIGPFASPAAAGDLVDAAEGLGYEDVWFGDHVVVPDYAAHLTAPEWLEPLSCCLLALGRSERIGVGTDVLVLPYRNPIVVAKMAATAQLLGGGRLTLGVGVGYLRGEFEALGADHGERGAVTDEYLEVIRLLWGSGGEPVGYSGGRVAFDGVCFGPTPPSGPPPLWVGGNAAVALRRAARWGDGWHPLFPTPGQYATKRSAIMAARGEAGRGSEPFTCSMSCATTRLVESEATTYDTGSWADLPDVPEDFGYAPPVPVTGGGRPRFVGTPDQVAADVDEYTAAGVEHFTLRFANGGPGVGVAEVVHQAEWFAREVMPRFVSPSPSAP